MNDDIVTRLRAWGGRTEIKSEAITGLFREAADEIETLRAIADNNRSWLSDDDHTALLRAAEQVALAHTIIGSEAMIWLIDGGHHDGQWRNIISRLTRSYWDRYGNVYRPKKESADSVG